LSRPGLCLCLLRLDGGLRRSHAAKYTRLHAQIAESARLFYLFPRTAGTCPERSQSVDRRPGSGVAMDMRYLLASLLFTAACSSSAYADRAVAAPVGPRTA